MSNFVLKTNVFLKKSTREHGILGFSEICDFAVCGGVFCTFAYSRGLFSVNFLHFLQKYRCVPKIGFPADIFLSFSFIFFRSIVVYLKLGSRLTFLLTFLLTFALTFLLTFLLTFSLTFWLTFLLTFPLTFSLTF